jgi:hypothetical protein
MQPSLDVRRLPLLITAARRRAGLFDRLLAKPAFRIRHRHMCAKPAAIPGAVEPDRRPIKRAAPTLGDAAIAQPPASGRQQWARLIENTTMIF